MYHILNCISVISSVHFLSKRRKKPHQNPQNSVLQVLTFKVFNHWLPVFGILLLLQYLFVIAFLKSNMYHDHKYIFFLAYCTSLLIYQVLQTIRK